MHPTTSQQLVFTPISYTEKLVKDASFDLSNINGKHVTELSKEFVQEKGKYHVTAISILKNMVGFVTIGLCTSLFIRRDLKLFGITPLQLFDQSLKSFLPLKVVIAVSAILFIGLSQFQQWNEERADVAARKALNQKYPHLAVLETWNAYRNNYEKQLRDANTNMDLIVGSKNLSESDQKAAKELQPKIIEAEKNHERQLKILESLPNDVCKNFVLFRLKPSY
ncbi:MAG: hypothetical protein H0W88_09385 [Parachlamydiaceae bacterium]|nr:hypothetical protein [Parachlamydiaceae bacterium]